MKIELEKLVVIFKGKKSSDEVIPAQEVEPLKINFKARRISCRLKRPDHPDTRGRNDITILSSFGFDRFIVCDADDMASVLYLQEEK